MAERLLTTRELQDLLQLDRVTIYKMVKEGELPALRVGGQWRFSLGAVEAWLQNHDKEARPGSGRPDPSSEMPDLSAIVLPDLIPLDTLQSIQNQFAHLLGVAAFTVDLDGKPFLPCSRCSRFCQVVHTTEAGMAACQVSWRAMTQARRPEASVHTCHAGVQYAGAPIFVAGQPIAVVTAGQFLTDKPDAEQFRIKAEATGRAIGVDGQALAEARDSLEVVREERALQITGLLATIANTLSAIGYQSLQMRQNLAQIAALSSRVAGPGP
jgi:excisionase family DNA binding protein